ncbi:hypothetical protein ACLOJK_028483 [Asimina triloba]
MACISCEIRLPPRVLLFLLENPNPNPASVSPLSIYDAGIGSFSPASNRRPQASILRWPSLSPLKNANLGCHFSYVHLRPRPLFSGHQSTISGKYIHVI